MDTWRFYISSLIESLFSIIYIMEFPYKKSFVKESAKDLFDNLTKYKPRLNRSLNTPFLQYNYHNLFGDGYLSFETTDEDYWKINIITDLFVEEIRIKCNVDNYQSLYNMWNDKNKILQNKVLKIVKDKTNKMELREAMYSFKDIKECNLYKTTLALSFVKYFNARKVLDLSSGWGDRMIGCMAGGVKVYHGYDPNTDLQASYKQMISQFAKKEQDIRVLPQGVEGVTVLENYYDLFLSSPPFFTKEIYSKDKTQSTSLYITLDSWIVNFLFVYIDKAWKGLRFGGTFVIYISDTPKLKICDRMNDYILQKLDSVYMGVIGSTSGNRHFEHWVWKKLG
jgi:hypothetical protein